jgi:hypothetical protein
LDEYKIQYFVGILMYNKHTVASYAAIISSILAVSVLAIGFIQHVVAQGNNTGSSSSSGGVSSNMTGGGGNMTSGNTTSSGSTNSSSSTGSK